VHPKAVLPVVANDVEVPQQEEEEEEEREPQRPLLIWTPRWRFVFVFLMFCFLDIDFFFRTIRPLVRRLHPLLPLLPRQALVCVVFFSFFGMGECRVCTNAYIPLVPSRRSCFFFSLSSCLLFSLLCVSSSCLLLIEIVLSFLSVGV